MRRRKKQKMVDDVNYLCLCGTVNPWRKYAVLMIDRSNPTRRTRLPVCAKSVLLVCDHEEGGYRACLAMLMPDPLLFRARGQLSWLEVRQILRMLTIKKRHDKWKAFGFEIDVLTFLSRFCTRRQVNCTALKWRPNIIFSKPFSHDFDKSP